MTTPPLPFPPFPFLPLPSLPSIPLPHPHLLLTEVRGITPEFFILFYSFYRSPPKNGR